VGPPKYVTDAEVRNMITEGLKDYEKEVVEPRHKETQADLTDIKALINKAQGAFWAVGGAFTIIFTIFKIVEAVKK
jgi:hypothetical protein